MQADLSSFTDAAQHVLYDPEAGARPTRGPADLEAVLASAESGALLPMNTGDDGDIEYRLFIEEELPYEMRQRIAKTTKDVLLRVPSGKLLASGLEYVGEPKEASSTAEIPAGNYLIDVHELDYDWDRDIEPVLEKELGPRYKREMRIGAIGGVFFFAGAIATIGGLVSWTPAILLAGIASLVLAVAVLAIGMPRGDYEEKKTEIARRFPGLVLAMRRLPDDADLAAYKGQQLQLVE